jgi:hypothetical protein
MSNLTFTIAEVFLFVGSLVGVWIKHQVDYAKLGARVDQLERSDSEIVKDIKYIRDDIQEIKLLLAKNQMQ